MKNNSSFKNLLFYLLIGLLFLSGLFIVILVSSGIDSVNGFITMSTFSGLASILGLVVSLLYLVVLILNKDENTSFKDYLLYAVIAFVFLMLTIISWKICATYVEVANTLGQFGNLFPNQ